LAASAVVFFLVHMSTTDARVVRGILAAATIAALVGGSFKLLGLNDMTKSPMWLLISSWVMFVPTIFIAASYLNIALRLKVTEPSPVLTPAVRKGIAELMEAEDLQKHSIYNHVGGLTVLKAGFFRPLRWLRTWLALMFLNFFYRVYFVSGKLASFPTIHFAQWTLVDARRLLFLTNYDGSADSYLDDFFDSLAKGVAFIWYDTQGFPNTIDARRLKTWVREGQTLAHIRYRAPVYDGLTVGMINNNTFIRTRLLHGSGDRSARRWLRRFATCPVEPTRLSRLAGLLKDLGGVSQ